MIECITDLVNNLQKKLINSKSVSHSHCVNNNELLHLFDSWVVSIKNKVVKRRINALRKSYYSIGKRRGYMCRKVNEDRWGNQRGERDVRYW